MDTLLNLKDLANDLVNKYQSVFTGEEIQLPIEFKQRVKSINSNSIEYQEYSAIVSTKGVQKGVLNIYLPNQWFYIASFFTAYYKELQKYKQITTELFSTERLKTLKGGSLTTSEKNKLTNRLSADNSGLIEKFVTDYDWWGGGKTIDRTDFYVSPLLNYARLVNATQSYVADLCAFLAENDDLVSLLYNTISEQGDVSRQSLTKSIDYFKKNPLQQIFYGAPGTGKSHEIKKLTKGESVIRTTFHPDSDYSTFVGCYKPTMDEVDTQVVPVVVKSGISLQDPGTYKEKRITYKFVMQAFLKAYLGAWKKWADAGDDGVAPQFLVIEEINRGNCAQIFGDLFQLLDRSDNNFSEYPIEADTDLQQEIERAFKEHKDYKLTNTINVEGAVKDYISNYDSTLSEDIQSGRILLFPPNLYIWATMNTSDQSLFPIDSAFKRRWEWRYIKIAEGRDEATRKLLNWTVKFEYKEEDKPFTFECSWWEFIKAINEKIAEATSSDDKKLGYFFCKPKVKNSTTIDEERFVGKVVFYLWNDVFKDEENPIFKVNEGKNEPSFDAFYKEDEVGKTVVDTAALRKFMHNVFGENKDQYTETEKSEE